MLCNCCLTLIIIKLMAFVFRNQRRVEQSRRNDIVGPGSYNFQVKKQVKIPKAYVPFGSMQPKIKQIATPATSLVGPGSYNIDVQRSGQKIIVSSQTEDIKILEISRPNPVFKSGVPRFQPIKEELITPGPGEYNIKPIVSRPKMLSTNTTSTAKPKILEHLININQYQSIPSIPSNIHAYGYNQNDNNELELNQPPIECYKGQKQDRVGPGQYNANITAVKARGCSWSQPKAKRGDDIKSTPNVGPGSYEVISINPLYNYKPSVGFASKTVRTMDQRKGALIQPKINPKDDAISAAQSRIFSEKGPVSTNVGDSDDDQYEYIDQTTPGPGSYLEISDVKKFKVGKTSTSFGNSQRFANKVQKATAIKHVGPGSYNIENKFGKKYKQQKLAIIKEEPRCPSLVSKLAVDLPGPGAYEPRNTMEDKLIYKIQRGYRGQFGSTEARGARQGDQEQIPGPGAYNPVAVVGEKEVASVFKSKIQRSIIDDKKVVPPIGSYNLIYNDIATRIIKEEEEDPDLIIRKPGFGVGEPRFPDPPAPRDDQYEDDDIIKQIQQKHREERKMKMLKNSAVFKSSEPRLKEFKGSGPGPGSYYDGEQDYWNKRTYNILFADI